MLSLSKHGAEVLNRVLSCPKVDGRESWQD